MNAQSCWNACVAAAALSVSATSVPAQAQLKVDAKLPEYKAVKGVSGRLTILGSDTMKNVMTYWGDGFKKFYPDIQIEIQGRGATTGPYALLAGNIHFAPMSRSFTAKEIAMFRKEYGHEPTGLTTCVEMLAVFVHKDNPLKGLTLPQLDAIFSRTRKGGFGKAINRWGALGLEGEWANKPIVLYGRNSASASYGYFKEKALFSGDFRDEVKEQPGSSSVVQGVGRDKYGIGYAGIAYKTADVRALALAQDAKTEATPAEPERAVQGDYPLARKLYVYLNHKPGAELDPLRREFVRYLYSKQGQADVLLSGYVPMDETVAAKARASVAIK